MKRHEEYYFRDGNICFLVENRIFRLHRFFFERESDYFRDRLGPSNEGEPGEDGSPNSPYRICDVTSEEFAQFVWVWYNPKYSFAKQSREKWLTILRVATRWRFHEIRKLAIRHLEEMAFQPIEKISIYKEYDVDHELLLPAYVSLCRSPTLPSPAEGKILTLETVLKIASAREQVLQTASERGYKTPLSASVPDDVVNTIVAELFGLTPHSGQTVGFEGQAMNNGTSSGDNSVDTGEVITVKQPHKKGRMNGAASQELPPATNGTGANKGKQKHVP
jgi:hypothetical protein